ncbi:hypothetical protein QFC21_002695 [Naganishia friedmannii]|uniref:Uncharacterized protein n=1 Tax=Naganishia friedmannii TaxID=89922 RepID=A0ACC2VWN0_9TREE|nr:hypothetical protein QFC21_002695 [Naganishia friedmannii]
MSTPVSFTVRPPTRPHSPQSSTPSSRETSSAPEAPRSAFRIATAPGRPSPLGPAGSGGGRSGRTATGGRDRFGRIRLGGHEDSDDDDDDDQGRFSGQASGKSRRDEEIVGLGEGGVESKIPVKPAGPLVIASLPNRDWRQSSTTARRLTYVPESRRGRHGDTTVEREGDEEVRAGLQVAQPRAVSPTVDADDARADMPANGEPQVTDVPLVPETLEQRAMRELMISAENGGEMDAEHRDMVIGLQGDTLNLRDLPVDETDAYRRDVLTRPEVSTLDDYSSVPIEAFGEAMLRGMGWRPEAPRSGPGVHVPQRRPEGLGLGATARAAPVDDKGKKAKRKEDAKTRGGRGYVPVVKRERLDPACRHVLLARAARIRAAGEIVTIEVGETNTTVIVETGTMTALDPVEGTPGTATLARGGRMMIDPVAIRIRKGIVSHGLKTARGIDIGTGMEPTMDVVRSGMNETIEVPIGGNAAMTVIVDEYGVIILHVWFRREASQTRALCCLYMLQL